MKGFVEQLMLAEKAAENIYFEKVNRELIEALHRQPEAGAKAGQAGADNLSEQVRSQARSCCGFR
jgi:hypothetical protein